MAHRLSPVAETELDGIWVYVATASGSMDAADRLVDAITDTFALLARYPHLGRKRDRDLRPGLRSFPVGDYIILYQFDGADVSILRVMRGSRNIRALLGDG